MTIVARVQLDPGHYSPDTQQATTIVPSNFSHHNSRKSHMILSFINSNIIEIGYAAFVAKNKHS